MTATKFLAPYALLLLTVLLHSKLFPNTVGDEHYIVPPTCRALMDYSSPWALRTGKLLLNGVGKRIAILEVEPKSLLVVLNILLLCGEWISILVLSGNILAVCAVNRSNLTRKESGVLTATNGTTRNAA